jgi:hypothetical protein
MALALAISLPTAATSAEDSPRNAQSGTSVAARPTKEKTLSPRDKALLAHEKHFDAETRLLAQRRHTAPIMPTPDWRVWDPSIPDTAAERNRQTAQNTASGTIRRPQAQHLIHMEITARRILAGWDRHGFISDPERQEVLQAFTDAGQVIFFHHGGGRALRPGIAQRINNLDLPLATGRALFEQFIRLAHIHRMLAGPPQTPRKRAALEDEFARLAAQLYQ